MPIANIAFINKPESEIKPFALTKSSDTEEKQLEGIMEVETSADDYGEREYGEAIRREISSKFGSDTWTYATIETEREDGHVQCFVVTNSDAQALQSRHDVNPAPPISI